MADDEATDGRRGDAPKGDNKAARKAKVQAAIKASKSKKTEEIAPNRRCSPAHRGWSNWHS